MELLLNHKGLKVKHSDEYERVYYYNDDMLKNNVLITEDTLMNDNESGKVNVQTSISVKHFNEIDAVTYDIYWGDLLSPIQVYRITLDIYEMYKNYPLNLFLELIDDISTGSMSAASQSKQQSRDEIMDWIKGEFEEVMEGSER
ncbi:hypothetical protein [Paenibacillus cremeus]|uniref:Uncharacterized protein n=1 Tax=Paenibacillus cremeus TaxID=2163881 RepID=A0A559KCK2_9BACL|nr:hypothetical protein [Paenibacillus cremeus]TVY09858.1 hypothetical protein FPZ49_10825 [Paenibacillus cremeus]